MVLGMMRVKALIVSLPSNYEHIHSENELCLQLKSFITDRILSSDIQIRCTGCTPGCLFSQSAIPPHKGRHAGKWPGYAKSWSTGKDEQDISNIRRFTSLCDEFGLDAFALATLLEEYGKNNGMLPDNAEELLDELEKLNDASASSYLHTLLTQAPLRRRSNEDDPGRYFMDSLGLCRFSTQPLLNSSEAWSAFKELTVQAFHLSKSELANLVGSMPQ